MINENALLTGIGAVPDPAREGLPYWAFWLLLCVIILLLFFIFLRDKDLRRRLSAFLSGAKRKMIRLRLAARLRREKEKKAGLWKELGRKAWSEDVRIEGTEETFRSLTALEEEMNRRQAEWQDVYGRIDALETAREKARKLRKAALEAVEEERRPMEERMAELLRREKDLGKRRPEAGDGPAGTDAPNEGEAARVAAEIAAVKAEVGRLREKSRETHRAHDDVDKAEEREIREWEQKKEEIQDRIIDAKKSSEPLYESLGRALDGARVEHKELALVYFQIDSVERAIRDLQARIEKLS
jgi:ubiquinone biosynthesis protein UbiJ